MNEKLEKLISFAISDGIVTDKEKEILFRKAVEEGADLDEFEMILNAKLYEKQQEQKEKIGAQITLSQTQIAGKTNSNKEGELKKCPNCGSSANSFILNCVDCGHEFRNIKSSSAIELLFQEI
jgi:DNA-directed RNA polymerase subunit RPC12/RpoP